MATPNDDWGTPTQKEEPVTIAVPLVELKQWLGHIEQGLEPVVKFSDDATAMQSAAYRERGIRFEILNQRIRAFVRDVSLIGFCLLLVGCSNAVWKERSVPTTDAERQAIAQHVERVLDTPYVMSGDDQDWEDVVDSTYREATILFVRKTYWEWYSAGMFDYKATGYTGRWRYADETETKPPLAQSP